MSDDIEIDLDMESDKPTMAEKLYAQRIAAGHAPAPEDGDPSFTKGTQQALSKLQRGAVMDGLEPSSELAQLQLSEWIGQRKFSSALQKLLTVSDLVEIQKIKESKTYKGLKAVVDGKVLTVRSFEDFCRSFGASAQHVDEQILNLRTFGPEFLEFADQSLGYRALRNLRKLPDDERLALTEAAKTGDKDTLIDLAETLIERHAKEKSALEEAVAESAEEVITFKRREKNYDAEIEKLSSQVARLSEAKQRTTSFTLRTEEIREECMALQLGACLHLDSLRALFDEVNAEGPHAPEWRIQIEQLWVIAHTVASRGLDMIGHMQALMSGFDMPERVTGEHILSAAEAERWLHDAPLIENKYEAGKLARQEKRDAEKPRGRGRPKGSTNKAEE